MRGNHDHGGAWAETAAQSAPKALPSGAIEEVSGLPVLTLEWPGLRRGDRMRHDGSATADVIRLMLSLAWRRIRGRAAPVVVLSHAPPLGVGDRAADPFHIGFSAYRWLLDRMRPPLWLHGHVHPASVEEWRLDHDGSTVVNVTGAVLVEIEPPPDPAEAGGRGPALR